MLCGCTRSSGIRIIVCDAHQFTHSPDVTARRIPEVGTGKLSPTTAHASDGVPRFKVEIHGAPLVIDETVDHLEQPDELHLRVDLQPLALARTCAGSTFSGFMLPIFGLA